MNCLYLKDYLTYSKLMRHGNFGLNLALSRKDGNYNQLTNFILPLNQKIIKNSNGVLVHSMG